MKNNMAYVLQNKVPVTEVRYNLKISGIKRIKQDSDINIVTITFETGINTLYYGKKYIIKLLDLYINNDNNLISIILKDTYKFSDKIVITDLYNENLIFIGIENKKEFYNSLLNAIKRIILEISLQK